MRGRKNNGLQGGLERPQHQPHKLAKAGSTPALATTLTHRQRQVAALAVECLKLPQVEIPVRHHFFPGLYVREAAAKAGTFLIGHVHKTEHCWILSKGKIRTWNEFSGVQTIEAPAMGRTLKGSQAMVIVLEDCIFTTLHPTKAKTVASAMKNIIVPFRPESGSVDGTALAKQLALLCQQQ